MSTLASSPLSVMSEGSADVKNILNDIIDVDIDKVIQKANLAWVLPRWADAFSLYKSIEKVATGHHNGHVAYRLGLLARRGFGDANPNSDALTTNSTSEDYFKVAKELVTKSAEEEDCEALCDLGHMYENGNAGYETSVKLAVKYYRMAADKGHPRGQYNLAVMLQQEGAKSSAQDYYKLAAKADYPCAQYNLACMYHREKDFKSAIHYFAKAAYWGDGDAQNQLTKLFSDDSLTIPRIQFLVEEWREYFPNLHITCQHVLKEMVLILRAISFTEIDKMVYPELIQVILDFVVKSWPLELKHFQFNQSTT